MDNTVLQSLTKMLWPDGCSPSAQQVYWLLDGARDPQIAPLVQTSGLAYDCLFAGDLHPRLKAAAPYLLHLEAGSAITNRLLQLGWGKAWGIFALAAPDITLTELRLHFKKFLRAKTEEGKELAFRFYDPRVLNIYLPTCNPAEFESFIGPLSSLCAELGDSGQIGMFVLDGQTVVVRATALT